MSTILEGQVIGWREQSRPRSRERLFAPGALRTFVVLLSVVAALVYFVTASQTAAVVAGLAREALAPRVAARVDAVERPSPVVVTVRPAGRTDLVLKP